MRQKRVRDRRQWFNQLPADTREKLRKRFDERNGSLPDGSSSRDDTRRDTNSEVARDAPDRELMESRREVDQDRLQEREIEREKRREIPRD
jgi:hypothetical protein